VKFVGLNALCDAALSVFYPQACRLCEESVEAAADGATCAACWQKTRIFRGDETICGKCSAILSFEAGKNPEVVRCQRCNDKFFTAARAVGVYEKALRIAVLDLKEKPFVAARLEDLLFRVQQKSPLNHATKIIPVPLHPRRERERGFNQASILARAVSRKSNLPIHENILIRTIHTKAHRADMDAQARLESVENCFAVKNPRSIQNEKILLFDDVFTSGATASACAEVLRENGAGEVFVLTIARAVWK